MARPRKPTAVKKMTNTLEPSRQNFAEPTPERAIPLPPSKMRPAPRKIWAGLCQLLDEIGVLTVADVFVLECLSNDLADLREAREVLHKRDGGAKTYKTVSRDGSIMYRPFPEVAMIADLDRRVGMWLSRTGLTPADRSRVNAVTDSVESNEFDI